MSKILIENFSSDDMRNFIREVVKEAFEEFGQIKLEQESINDELLTRKQAMEYLKVKSTKFNELRQEGYVTPIRLGKLTMYQKQDLVDLCDSLKN